MLHVPYAWYNKVDQHFLKLGFQHSTCEPTIYKNVNDTLELLLICLYIDDDIICLGSPIAIVNEFKLDMMHSFEMTDLGLLQCFLGSKVKQKEKSVFVSHRKYAEDLLKSFDILNCKKATAPMNTRENFQLEDRAGQSIAKKYQSMVGAFLCLSHTRPNMMFCIGVVPRFMNKLFKHHLGIVNRIMRHVIARHNKPRSLI